MKYLKLFESWNPLSDEDLDSAQELNLIGVVSDKELSELKKLRQVEQRIIRYNGVGSLNLEYCTLLKSLPAGLKVDGDLDLHGCKGLESIPADLEVLGELDLRDCQSLRSLPAGLKIRGGLDLKWCKGLESLPAGLVVGGQLEL